jgi:ankyrin repeat protein
MEQPKCWRLAKTSIADAALGDANINSGNDSALFRASKHGHLEVVKCLINNGSDIHAYNEHALRWASHNGHLAVVEYLLSHGANIHINEDETLINACYNGHLAVVELLVNNGADVHNDSALRQASINGHKDIVRYLENKKTRSKEIEDLQKSILEITNKLNELMKTQ